MNTILTLIISVLPIYLVLLYVYRKDDAREPKSLLKRLFIYGMIICIPIAIVEIYIGKLFPSEESMNLPMLLIYVFIDVALIEELGKWLVVYHSAYHHNAFDQIYDAIVYAVFVSLGFACFENIFYVLDSGITVGVFRAITAIPGHASDAIIMGNYLGLAKLADIKHKDTPKRIYLFLSIIVPTIMHTIYDYCLFTGNLLFIGLFFLFIIFIYIYSFKKIKLVSSHNRDLVNRKVVIDDDVKYCTKCGINCQGNYCYRCGKKL